MGAKNQNKALSKQEIQNGKDYGPTKPRP